MASPTEASPPAFQHVNTIELVSVTDSKITSVSVYAGRAEITRLFKVAAKTGQNQLNIVGLPAVLDQDSLRVEGRGAATIHDVTISTLTPPPIPTTSLELQSLLSTEKHTKKALDRALKSLSSLERYLSSLKAEHLEASKLGYVVQQYEDNAAELDDKVTDLEQQLKDTEELINQERKKLAGPTGNEKLNLKASIGVFADHEGEIKIALIYAVHNATWNAGYDIRVDMQTKEKPINIIYKGSITQSTGEDWDDVPLTLETATPTFGLDVPTLTPWSLSISPKRYKSSKSFRGPAPAFPQMRGGAPPELFMQAMSYSASEPQIEHRGLHVSSKGSVSATFGVPGLITIPSDGVGHNVTIVKLDLDANMSWVCVPKKDIKVHLKAKVKNASEYTLLPGGASVYVDGSFISKSEVPLVSPDESFDCPLGLDPSIRVTYHPCSKKVSQSGFYTKASNYSFSQRVSVHNTKSTSEAVKLKIIDQVPISEDSTISVKLVQPALTLPNVDATASATGPKVPPPVQVSSGVTAMWDRADEVAEGDVDLDWLGKEGRLCWDCSIPPQGKIGLLLQWEVTAPVRSDINGL